MQTKRKGEGIRADILGSLRRGLLLGVVLGAAACGAPADTQPAESTRTAGSEATAGDQPAGAASVPSVGARAARVVLLGTSLTAGLGLPPEEAYPTLVQAKADSAGLRVTIVNAGLSGETSAGALRRAGWVLNEPADLVVLEVGANDGLRGVNPDSTRENLVALVATIRREQPAARIALVQMEAPTNFGADYTRSFHQAYVDAAARTGVPLLPFLLDGVAGVARLNQGDGIHPNTEGARIVAHTMFTALLPILREMETPKGTGP